MKLKKLKIMILMMLKEWFYKNTSELPDTVSDCLRVKTRPPQDETVLVVLDRDHEKDKDGQNVDVLRSPG